MIAELRPMRVGIVLVLAGLLFGFGLGGVFGAAEDSLKGKLKADAAAVLDTVYKGDQAKADKVTSKAWSYMKRAHMHGGGMGAAALAMLLLVAAIPVEPVLRWFIALLLGAGSLGYPLFWLLAAFKAPGLGSTGAAKEALGWLAIPSSGCFLLGTVLVAGVFVRATLGDGVDAEPGPRMTGILER